jgi:hypothetical protein
VSGPAQPAPQEQEGREQGKPLVDRQLVLEQLGGWRGMVDATLPTIAFIVANSLAGLRPGIYAALVAAVLVFLLRLVRRESVQQAVSGLFAVAIAVAIAAWSGQARDFFVLGIVRSAAIAAVLAGSILVRRPLVGYAAEFLAPSHIGAMAAHSLPGLRRRHDGAATASPRPAAEPPAERHWREDPRALRAYGWLTALWAASFAVRAIVQGLFYRRDDVELLGTFSVILGLPVTAVCVVVTLWVVARLHRHRVEPAPPVDGNPSTA